MYKTCPGHVSALVWKGLKFGTSNTQKIYIYIYIYILKKSSWPKRFWDVFLYVVLAVLWGHVGRYDLRPQAMCMRPARAMWVLWFERVWSWELPTLKKIFFKKKSSWPKRFWDVFSLCSVGWSLRTCGKIWSKTPSYVYETCKGHESALVWKGLKLGTSNTQKQYKQII